MRQTYHTIKWLNISEIFDVIYKRCVFYQKRLINAQLPYLVESMKIAHTHTQRFQAQHVQDIKYVLPIFECQLKIKFTDC